MQIPKAAHFYGTNVTGERLKAIEVFNGENILFCKDVFLKTDRETDR